MTEAPEEPEEDEVATNVAEAPEEADENEVATEAEAPQSVKEEVLPTNEVATGGEEEVRCIKKVMQVCDIDGFSVRGLILSRLKRPCGKTRSGASTDLLRSATTPSSPIM